MTGLSAAGIHILPGLRQPIGDRLFQRFREYFQFDDHPLHAVRIWPDHEEIGAAPAQAVFAFHPAAPIDDGLQERLQQQLWPGFAVIHTGQPMFGMLPIELLESAEKFLHIQPAVLQDVPGWPDGALQVELCDEIQLARNDFPIDRIGNLQPVRTATDQAQVDHVLNVVQEHTLGEIAPF